MCKNLYYLFHMSSNRTLYDYNLALQSVVITRWWYSRVLSGPRYHLTRMRGTLGQSKKQQNTETNKQKKTEKPDLMFNEVPEGTPLNKNKTTRIYSTLKGWISEFIYYRQNHLAWGK